MQTVGTGNVSEIGIQRNQKDTAFPHRFSFFYTIGSHAFARPGVRAERKNWNASIDKQDGLTAEWGIKSLRIWIHETKSGTPQEKIKDGAVKAAEYAKTHEGARLRFDRMDGRIEWVFNKELSDFIREKLGMKPNEPIIFKKAKLVIDGSHPDGVEVNCDERQPATGASEYILRLQDLFDGRIHSHLRETTQLTGEMVESLKVLNSITKEQVESLPALLQKIELARKQ